MKIILFSDIHANMPALEAFWEHISTVEYDAIYCLGDLIGYNVWPNEVVDAIRKRKIPTIAGNHDYAISRLTAEYSPDLSGPRANSNRSKAYTDRELTSQNRSYLRSLPAQVKIVYQHDDKEIHLLLVHGSPISNTDYIYEDRPQEELINMLRQFKVDILCCGHTHLPYHRVIEIKHNGTKRYKHIINTGSIGKPKDKDPRGCYVILTIDHQSDLSLPESISVEHVRYSYDTEQAATAIEKSELPDAFAANLRNGY